jgi:hypothetical protein
MADKIEKEGIRPVIGFHIILMKRDHSKRLLEILRFKVFLYNG